MIIQLDTRLALSNLSANLEKCQTELKTYQTQEKIDANDLKVKINSHKWRQFLRKFIDVEDAILILRRKGLYSFRSSLYNLLEIEVSQMKKELYYLQCAIDLGVKEVSVDSENFWMFRVMQEVTLGRPLKSG